MIAATLDPPAPRRQVLFALAAGALAAFAGLTAAIASRRLPLPGDRTLLAYLSSRSRTPLLEGVSHFSHYAGGWKGVAILAATGAVLQLLLGRADRAARFAATVGVVVLVPLLKHAVERPAPPGAEQPFGFPSGHATGAVALVAAVLAVVPGGAPRRVVAVLGALWIAAVGAAVVADRGHWPSDVVAGWALATTWAAALAAATSGRRCCARR